MKCKNVQNHAELAYRLSQMSSALYGKFKPTEAELQAARHLQELAAEHARAARFENLFIRAR